MGAAGGGGKGYAPGITRREINREIDSSAKENYNKDLYKYGVYEERPLGLFGINIRRQLSKSEISDIIEHGTGNKRYYSNAGGGRNEVHIDRDD